jgi:hypothetical protein
MNGSQFAKMQLEHGLNLMNGALAGTTQEQYVYQPAGTCNPIGKNHIHALTSLDFFIIGMAKGGELSWPAFAAKHGLPGNPLEIWGYTGPVSMDAVNEYGAGVQQAALEYVSSLNDTDLDRQLETRFFGVQSVAYLIQLAAMHCVGHTGDMAAIKGIQGVKGLPF